jgi:VanZ family protein
MNEKTKYKLKILIVIGYMVFIYLFSEYKFPDPTEGEPSIATFSIFPFLHMGEFGLLTVLLMWIFYPKTKIVYLWLISILYGISDEIHQYFVPYRWFDLKDIMYDVMGASLGVLGFFILLFIYYYVFIIPKIRR